MYVHTLDLVEAFPFFVATLVVLVVVGSAASLGDCLVVADLEEADLEGGALLLGGGAVGLCFSSNVTTDCLEAG